MSKNNKERQQNQVVYSSVKKNGNSISLQGKCSQYEFKAAVSFEQFPDEKARDRAYKIWAETFIDAVVRNREYFGNKREKTVKESKLKPL